MSFKLFEIEFDGKKDSFEEGSKKMDEVCELVGLKFIREWIDYGVKKEKIDKDNVNNLFKWLKLLEEDFKNFFDIEKDIWK
jgi:hypothetical protein|tara:strand:+ start:546 stop:788 length:243 start_codon:yes stop_codon:yes gene_type:complete